MTDIANHLMYIEITTSITKWKSSMGILAWTIFLSTKAIKSQFRIRVSALGTIQAPKTSTEFATPDTLNIPPLRKCIILRIEHDVGHLLYQPICNRKYSSHAYLRRGSFTNNFYLPGVSRDLAVLREMGIGPMGQPRKRRGTNHSTW
jgi:hypothetical protein